MCVSSAIRRNGSRKTICASCGCSGFTPGTARAKSMPTACARVAAAQGRRSRRCRASASRRKCCGCWRRRHPVPVLRAMAASGVLSEVLPGALQFVRFQKFVRSRRRSFLRGRRVVALGFALLGDEAAGGRDSRRGGGFRTTTATGCRDMMGAPMKIVSYLSIREVRRALYRFGVERCSRIGCGSAGQKIRRRRTRIQWRALARARRRVGEAGVSDERRDVMAAGVPQGPLVGKVLERSRGLVDRQRFHRRSCSRWPNG